VTLSRFSAIIKKSIGGNLMFLTELSELLEEIREIEIYGNVPQNWTGGPAFDDYCEVNTEITYQYE